MTMLDDVPERGRNGQDPSRRDVLATMRSGLGLALAITLSPITSGEAAAQVASSAPERAPFAPNVWLHIAPDGIITIVSPAAELGQGSFTTLPLIVAEELDADWSKVRPVQPATWDEKSYGNPAYRNTFQTSASASVHGYFKPLRIAGAQARRVLLDAVAAKWGVPVGELTTEPSVVVHRASGRRIGYGEIAAFAQAPAVLPAITDAELKAPARFRYIGRDVPRVDVPLKVAGQARYGIDVRLPGMLYAAVLHPPYDGGAPEAIDEAAARKLPGITDIVRLPNGVGVIGASFEATQAAKNLLVVSWSRSRGASLDSERALDDLAAIGRDKGRGGVVYDKVGDAASALAGAAKVYRGEYRTRYVYHAQMEPMNATAQVAADGTSAEVWAGTQSVSSLIETVAKLLQFDRGKVTFHQHLVGGGYGRRGNHETVVDAVRLAKAVPGSPVKLILSREDDIAYGKFRPATAHHIEAGLDASGKVVAWHHRVVSESVAVYSSGDPTPRQDRIVMKGSPIAQYPIANKLAEHVIETQGARLSAWRGVGNGHNAFAAESFIDEIAGDLGKDPIAFRLALCEGAPRMQLLLRTVAEMSGWERARAQSVAGRADRSGTVLGVATMVKDDTHSAGVAEVSLDRATGRIKVHRFWCAIDAGIAVQPGNIAAQTEGSIVYGLGHVLREKIVIRDGRVLQSNYTDYEVARMADVPEIEVRVVSTDNPPSGAGEDGLPLIACAVGNAIATLTGVRLRELPFDAGRVRDALGA